MPFVKGPSGDFEPIKGLHGLVVKVQPNSVVRQALRDDLSRAKPRPREQRAAGGDDEEPEVHRPSQLAAERMVAMLRLCVGVEDQLSPESSQGYPSCKPMGVFEPIVILLAYMWVSCRDDSNKHGDEDPRRNEWWHVLFARRVYEVFR